MLALTLAGKNAVTVGGQKDITAGYCRVSTDSEEQANAMVVQKEAIKKFGVDVLFEDVLSGAGVTRPGYEDLKQLVFSRQVSRIVINNVSRLGRDFAEAVSFVAMCDEQMVQLISLCQPERPLTLSDSSELLMTIFPMAIAATYKMDNRKKILAGYKNGRDMGKPMRKPCWGYRLSADRLRLEPSEAFDTARRFIDHLKSHDWRMLRAFQTFEWSEETPAPWSGSQGVRAWLLNPTIRGGIAYGQIKNHRFETILWDRHQQLLTHDEFQEFETVRKLNQKMWGHNAVVKHRPLTSLCTCKECGKKMSYVSGRKYPAVRCKSEGCSQYYKSTREDKIIESLLPEVIEGASKALADAASAIPKENPKIDVLEMQIESLQKFAGDPTFDMAIQQKQSELSAMKAEQRPEIDSDVFERLANPLVWEQIILPDQKALTVVLHEAVEGIQIAKQSVASVHLRL